MRDLRKEFGAAVSSAANTDERIVVLSVDSGLSSGFGDFRDKMPKRYIELGIMEQAATGVAAGLASAGKIPVLCAIAPFVTVRNYEMFRNDVGYMRQNVKLVGRNGGLSYSQLGPTHHSLEDYALARMIPGVAVLSPQDLSEISAAVDAMLSHEGPVYMRIGSGMLPRVFDSSPLEIGRGRLIRSGSDVTVLSTGHITVEVMEATRLLQARGISVEHVGLATVWPLDSEMILESAARTGLVVTIEEHYERGGFGSAVAELLAQEPIPVTIVGVPHDFISSGPYPEVLANCGLDAEGLARQIEAVIAQR